MNTMNIDQQNTTVQNIQSTQTIPSQNQQPSIQQQIQDQVLATIKRQRETALDTVAVISAERDYAVTSLQRLEEESKRLKQSNLALLSELTAAKNQIAELVNRALSASNSSNISDTTDQVNSNKPVSMFDVSVDYDPHP